MFERLKGVFTREQASDVETESANVPLAAAMLLLEVAWADHELEDRELEQVKVALESMSVSYTHLTLPTILLV